ncbi:MAG: membrane-associated Zn-dependent protease 1 [Thermoplasmatales archaeon A-plasma]|nr:MAG: membrane-associated Zn-dependent protease 1 [Thermoplasmatales archaeon A-plasma]
MKNESINAIRNVVARYYDISSINELEDSVVIKTQNLDDYPEEYFDRLVRDLEALGYIAFTNGSSSDEIIIIDRPRQSGNKFLKLLLLAASLVSTAYFGIVYQASYFPESGLAGNIFSGIIFFLLPLSVVLGAREAGKYVALKKNGMSYTFPIFVPDPLGIGTMGIINAPSKPYTSRKAMIEIGSYSLLFGLVISTIFYVLGSVLTFYYPPSAAVVNSPVERIGSPILLQIISMGLVPSNGILDPLALAGWAGLITTAFNALPLGFLDGGLISSAVLGKRSVYLSYLSVLAILGLGVIYPPWIVLAVFALLVGLRGPQPLNNHFRLRSNAKVLAAVALVVIVVGIAPFPFQTSLNSFTISASQLNFVTYQGNSSVAVNMEINNTGSSTMVPAFEISPSVAFTLSGKSKSISPGQDYSYSLDLNTSGSVHSGFNQFTISVYSGSVVKTFSVIVISVNLTRAFMFNNQAPLYMSVNKSQQFSISLTPPG